MKTVIAIVGFTVALIGAGELCRTELLDVGLSKVTPVHPFTELDQRYTLSAIVEPFLVPIGEFEVMRNIKEGCSAEVGVDLFMYVIDRPERRARDGLIKLDSARSAIYSLKTIKKNTTRYKLGR